MCKQEFRFSVTAINQGHYTGSLAGAIEGAMKLSERFPGDEIRVEQFRPIRMPIMTVKNGRPYEVSPIERHIGEIFREAAEVMNI